MRNNKLKIIRQTKNPIGLADRQTHKMPAVLRPSILFLVLSTPRGQYLHVVQVLPMFFLCGTFSAPRGMAVVCTLRLVIGGRRTLRRKEPGLRRNRSRSIGLRMGSVRLGRHNSGFGNRNEGPHRNRDIGLLLRHRRRRCTLRGRHLVNSRFERCDGIHQQLSFGARRLGMPCLIQLLEPPEKCMPLSSLNRGSFTCGDGSISGFAVSCASSLPPEAEKAGCPASVRGG